MARHNIVPGISAAALNRGFFRDIFPGLGGSLYAEYLIGNNWPRPDSYDYSFHQRALTAIGASTRSNGYATPTSANYYVTPFTDAMLLAAGVPAEFSVVAVCCPDLTANGTIFSSEDDPDNAGWRAWLSAGGTLASNQYGAAANDTQLTLPASEDTDGATFELFVLTYSAAEMKVYRKGPTTDFTSAAAVPLALVASGRPFRIGRRWPNASDAAGNLKIDSIAFYSRVIPESEIKTKLYPQVAPILAEYNAGIVI